MCGSSSDGSLHDPGWAHSCGDPVPQTRHTFKLLVFFCFRMSQVSFKNVKTSSWVFQDLPSGLAAAVSVS